MRAGLPARHRIVVIARYAARPRRIGASCRGKGERHEQQDYSTAQAAGHKRPPRSEGDGERQSQHGRRGQSRLGRFCGIVGRFCGNLGILSEDT